MGNKKQFVDSFIQQLQKDNTIYLFSQLVRELFISKVVNEIHGSAQLSTPAANYNKNKDIASAISRNSGLSPEQQSDEYLKETIEYIQYTLSSNIEIYDLRRKKHMPMELPKPKTNMKDYGFQSLRFVITTDNKVYLVLNDQQAQSIGFGANVV